MQAASNTIPPSVPRKSDTVVRLQALRLHYLRGMVFASILGLLFVLELPPYRADHRQAGGSLGGGGATN